VTYAVDEVRGREIRALLKGSDSLNCGDLLVITWDLRRRGRGGGKKDLLQAALEMAAGARMTGLCRAFAILIRTRADS